MSHRLPFYREHTDDILSTFSFHKSMPTETQKKKWLPSDICIYIFTLSLIKKQQFYLKIIVE